MAFQIPESSLLIYDLLMFAAAAMLVQTKTLKSDCSFPNVSLFSAMSMSVYQVSVMIFRLYWAIALICAFGTSHGRFKLRPINTCNTQ